MAHNNIRELRLEKLMTQARLVETCNVPGFDVPTLSKIENGHILPSPEIEKALLRALQATRDELYGEWKEVPLRGVGAKKREYERFPAASWDVKLLVSCLRPGKENATPRWWLRHEMKMSDRRVRKLIEQAQKAGFLIGNMSDGDGYFLINTSEEGFAYYQQEASRAKQISDKIEPLRQYLTTHGVEV